MTILQIPVDSKNAAFEQIITLEGTDYLIRIYWNTREESWYMDIFSPDRIPILCGLKLVVNYNFNGFYVNPDTPPGMFFLYDDTNLQTPCGRDELGGRCILIYITSDDEFFV